MKAKIVRFLMGFDIDEGINSKDAAFACVMEGEFQAESAEDSGWTRDKRLII